MLDRLVGKKVIGIKQCTKAIKNGEGKVLYVAKDVDCKLIAPLMDLVDEHNIRIESVETKKELGRICGIEVESSVALLL
ncbi:L7Ae/L30e/S12e/Gadd45 family ribosomal protein [Clostridium paraputrificum]|uniref:L7Ae/L30e/S12e/Gadd45 family ribosomal protein n=1 Tax=Clostridium TaxID=1485 RepID=UPI003D355B7A